MAVLLIISLAFLNICASARTLTENVLPAGVNESSLASAVPADVLKNLPNMSAIPANISNNLPAVSGLATNISNNLSSTNDPGMQNAMQGNVTPQLPTIPQMPDFSALSNLSLPPMPSAPKLPKIPTNISIMGLEVPIPKFVTTIFNGGQT